MAAEQRAAEEWEVGLLDAALQGVQEASLQQLIHLLCQAKTTQPPSGGRPEAHGAQLHPHLSLWAPLLGLTASDKGSACTSH